MLRNQQTSPSPTAQTLVVLVSFNTPSPTDNPYLTLFTDAVDQICAVKHFSWRAALFSKYDVFHVHWMESLITGQGKLMTLRRLLLSTALLVRLRVSRIPIVRTLHNKSSRNGGLHPLQRIVSKGFDSQTASWIIMNSEDEEARSHTGEVQLIPHGHYRDWYKHTDVNHVPSAPQLLTFGLIRPYKRIDTLAETFSAMRDDNHATLLIAGRVFDEALETRIRKVAASDTRVTLVARHIDDDDLANYIASSTLVVLPYEEFFNSGCALLSLSLNTPILVPDSVHSRELAAEVGARWVIRYRSLSPQAIEDAIETATAPRVGEPNLTSRNWDVIAKQTAEVYRAAINVTRA